MYVLFNYGYVHNNTNKTRYKMGLYCSLCHMNRYPKIYSLFFFMPIPYPLALQIKHYTPSEGKLSMHLYSPLILRRNEYALDFLY